MDSGDLAILGYGLPKGSKPMMLLDNLPQVLKETEGLERVLDVGGSSAVLNTATHVVDLVPIAGKPQLLSTDRPLRQELSLCLHDICRKPWPFPDHYFDYAFCSHTLEDIRDPIAACEEMMRVARRGYIEVPSRMREIFHAKRLMPLRRILGRPLRIGFGHHRWFCEREGDGLKFTAKTLTAVHSTDFVLTRDEIGRDLTAEESAIGLFWEQRFTVREEILIVPGQTEDNLAAFKQRALANLT